MHMRFFVLLNFLPLQCGRRANFRGGSNTPRNYGPEVLCGGEWKSSVCAK
jgi:hypothetical protein